jgi:hypothetical protein
MIPLLHFLIILGLIIVGGIMTIPTKIDNEQEPKEKHNG